VGVNDNLVITFSENVDVETGNIIIKKNSNNSVFETIDVTSGKVTGTGTNTITINPAGTFDSEIEYYVLIDATAFDDAVSNSYAGISSTTAWSFTTADVTVPTVSTLSPADDATDITVDANLIIIFNENVDAETGDITIKKVSDNSVFETVNVSSGNVTGSGTNTITINPSGTFSSQTEYYVLIDVTAFDDPAGNSYTGITSTTAWRFTTADVIAPVVSSFNPIDNATGVALGADLVVTFSENVVKGTGNIIIYNSDNSVFETISVSSTKVSIAGSQVTIYPAGTFVGETSYYIKIDATAFDDAGGNSYAGIGDATTWNFTSADVTAPTVSLSSTASSLTNTSPIPVTAMFSESVTGFSLSDITVGNGSASNLSGTGANYTFDVTPSSDGTVTAEITSNKVQDGSGNGNTVSERLTRTYDGTVPTISISSSVGSSGSATSTSPIPIAVTFNEAVTGFVEEDLTVEGGTITASSFSGSGASYFFTVTPSGEGTVSVDIAANKAQDGATNGNTVATQFTIMYDTTVPTVSISSSAGSSGSTTNTSPIPITITFSESVTGFTEGDVTIINGSITASSFTGSGSSYQYTVTPSGNATITIAIATGVAQDAAGNGNTAANQFTITFDNIAPTITITSLAGASGSATNTQPIPVTVTFSESVTGFIEGDITITNGSVSSGSFSGLGSTYSFTVIPAGDPALVKVDIAANEAQDTAGNNNTAATQFTITYDSQAVTVIISSSAGSSGSFTNSSPVPIVVNFSDNVTGFEASDVSIIGGSVTSGSFSGSNNSYVFTITPSREGTIMVVIAANVAQNSAGTGNTTAGQFTLVYDTTSPTVIIASSLSSPTKTSLIPVTVTFSEDVTGFVEGDITVTNGSITGSSFTGSGSSYSFTATPSSDGIMMVDITANKAQDSAGNSNTAATQFNITYDSTSPTVVLTSTATSPTSTTPIPMVASFNEAVTGFVIGDITVGNGTANNFSGSGATYTFNIIPTDDGAVTVDITTNVAQDAASNGNTAATQFAITYDSAVPTVAISSTASSPTKISPIPITVTFSESVSGFIANDITVNNGTVSNFQGSGTTYTFSMTPTAEGIVTIDVAANIAQDASGNGNTAATQFSIMYDITSPAVTISSLMGSSGSSTNTTPIPITVTFTESVTGFTENDVSTAGGTITNESFSGSGATYLFSVTPDVNGTITIDIAADIAQDAAGNNNTAASQFTIIYDTVVPSVTITSSATSPTNTSPIPITVTFSESVTGFVEGDISITNGSLTNDSFTGSGSTYSLTITPSGYGTIITAIIANVAQDAAGNGNSTATQFPIVYDMTIPTVTISSSAGISGSATNTQPIPFVATFSESVTDFDATDLTITNGTITGGSFSGSGSSYSFSVLPITDPSIVKIDIAENIAYDAAGNGNSATAQFIITYDSSALTAIFASSLGASGSSTNVSSIPITITFSESVTGFEASDVTIDNGSMISGSFSGSESSYSFTVSPSGDGVVTMAVAANIAQNASGSGNSANQFSITYDSTNPSLTISSSTGDSGSTTSTSPIPFTVTFSENVTGFDVNDLDIENGSPSNFVASSSTTYTFDVTPTGTGVVTITVDVAENKAQDAAGNGNLAASQFPITFNAAGITVSPISSLITTESGGTETFTIVLLAQPSSDVTLSLSSSNTSEGIVSPSSVTFTSNNWSTSQTITITGVDDYINDGNQTYTIFTSAALSSDLNYSSLDPSDVTVSNSDNDVAGITVDPVTGLTTTESGGIATFVIVLLTQPSADVSLTLSSSNIAEGSVLPSSVTFNSSNWNSPQTITVIGVDDISNDGDQIITIITAAAVSDDQNYHGLNPTDVSVTNTDNDGPGITVYPTSSMVTTEAGGDTSFTVVLTTQPSEDVTVTLSSSDNTEGIVSPSSVTFTSSNWDTPQTVSVTGVNDDEDDGDRTYTIVISAAISSDPNYNGLDPADVSVTNTDDDGPGITVSPISGLITSETGDAATFTVVLISQPSEDVLISMASSNVAEGSISPSSITFNSNNWDTEQTITVTGADDNVDDGDQSITIILGTVVSNDPNYSGVNPADVSVTNTDNDVAGFVVYPVTELTTSESGEDTSFTIVLTTQPTADVTIGVNSSDASEGTVSSSSITFTSINWSTPQTITITGSDDDEIDGNLAFTIVTGAAVSDDPNYNSLDPDDVTVTNNDNDGPGLTMTSDNGLVTTEAGGITSLALMLKSKPSKNVMVTLSSSDTTEGIASPSSLFFSSSNWDTAQTVLVTGMDDDVVDGDQIYTINGSTVSDDPNYDSLLVTGLSLTNTDDDSAGIMVDPTDGLTTIETGEDTSFSFVLTSQPIANVTVVIFSSDTTEGTISPLIVTFTSNNWNSPQTITIKGVDDNLADGDQDYLIVSAPVVSGDPNYSGLDPADVFVTNIDAEPVIVLSVSELQFDSVRRDSTAEQTVQVFNNGMGTLFVSQITVSDSVFAVRPTSLEVLPSDTGEIVVSFTPEEAVPYQETLSLVHNDSQQANMEITLEGLGVKPTIVTSSLEFNFDNILINRDSILTLTVSNDGNDTLTIDSMYTSNPVYTVSLSDSGGSNNINQLSSESITRFSIDETRKSVNAKSSSNTGVIPAVLSVSSTVEEIRDKSIFKSTTKNLTHSSSRGKLVGEIGRNSISKKKISRLSRNLNHTLDNTGTSFSQLPPRGSMDLIITFAPDVSGEFPAELTILSDDPDQLQLTITLTGIGISYPKALYNSLSFGISVNQEEDRPFDLVVSNSGDYPLDYEISVDALWNDVEWLSLSTSSGQVEGGDSETVIATVIRTNDLIVGTYEGSILITSNSGPDLSLITDVAAVILSVLPPANEIVEGDTLIPSGDTEPFEITDDEGNSLGVTVDFDSSQGVIISVLTIPYSAPSDSTTKFNDPNSVITNLAIGDFYWEILDSIPDGSDDGYVVDVTFDFSNQVGIQNPEKLRIAKRINYAGPGVPWEFIDKDSININIEDRTITARNQTDFSQWTLASDKEDNTLEDSYAPVVVERFVSPTTPKILEHIRINTIVTDESFLDSVNLYYIKGGETNFHRVPMSIDEYGLYGGIIPASEVTLTGVAYTVQAKDMTGKTSRSDTVSISVYFPDNTLSTDIDNSAFVNGIPKNHWSLISIPASLHEPDIAKIFSQEFGGKPSKSSWKMFKWSGSSWTTPKQAITGEGYWIYQKVKDNPTIYTGSGHTTDITGTPLALKPGWNIVGSPYSFNVDIDFDESLFYGPLTYSIVNGDGWTDIQPELKPWGGYIIYNRTNIDQIINIQPLNEIETLAKKTHRKGYQTLDGALDDLTGWKLQLMAKGNRYADVANYIGRMAGATEQLDYFDNPEPPYMEEYVSIFMNRSEWGDYLPQFTSDIRSLEETDGVWDLNLSVKGDKGPIVLSHRMWGEFPTDHEIVLLDLITRETYNLQLEEENDIIITKYSEKFPYPFKIIAGTPEFVSSTLNDIKNNLPEKFILSQNYPNPFNPTTRIQFAVPKPAKVTLTVYNIMGQEVATLVQERKEIGYYEIIWNGRDDYGKPVSTGVYIYRLFTDKHSQTRKMMLLK